MTVLRLSGEDAFAITAALTTLPPVRRVVLRALIHENELLDHALVSIFAAPNSFTGEDCVELALHGGVAVLTAVSQALVARGARPAEPGEFSRRAFFNQRLDLLQAEATADLIAAETEAQRRQAIQGADELQACCTAWRATLRLLLAQQEALIDFPDEDLPAQVEQDLVAAVAQLHGEMLTALAAAPRAAALRDGLEFVILGPPNAGKSTLLNALAGAEIAIVSASPGTTRDAIGVRLNLGGIPVHLTDTAGLRDSEDAIELEGMQRARRRAAQADLIIAVAAAPDGVFAAVPAGVETMYLTTKADLGGSAGAFQISAQTGHGVEALLAQLTATAQRLTDTTGAPAVARPRQLACIQQSAAALASALATAEPELRGEELRQAATALARLTGHIGVEEILDAVFSSFCIGK